MGDHFLNLMCLTINVTDCRKNGCVWHVLLCLDHLFTERKRFGGLIGQNQDHVEDFERKVYLRVFTKHNFPDWFSNGNWYELVTLIQQMGPLWSPRGTEDVMTEILQEISGNPMTKTDRHWSTQNLWSIWSASETWTDSHKSWRSKGTDRARDRLPQSSPNHLFFVGGRFTIPSHEWFTAVFLPHYLYWWIADDQHGNGQFWSRRGNLETLPPRWIVALPCFTTFSFWHTNFRWLFLVVTSRFCRFNPTF